MCTLFILQTKGKKKSMSIIKRQTKKLSAAISQQLSKTSRLKNTHTFSATDFTKGKRVS